MNHYMVKIIKDSSKQTIYIAAPDDVRMQFAAKTVGEYLSHEAITKDFYEGLKKEVEDNNEIHTICIAWNKNMGE